MGIAELAPTLTDSDSVFEPCVAESASWEKDAILTGEQPPWKQKRPFLYKTSFLSLSSEGNGITLSWWRNQIAHLPPPPPQTQNANALIVGWYKFEGYFWEINREMSLSLFLFGECAIRF